MSTRPTDMALLRGMPANLTLQVFAAALFVSATLMFEVQPMFTRMVLPMLGGSPGVWTVAMVFFQAVLLAGYFYAHMLTRYLPLRTAALLHIGVMALALLCLPVARAAGFEHPPETGTAFWLIGLFGASVGLPFFALAGNGPLLQAWFSRSGHPHSADPYFLYGASNLGSFAGLLAYPVLIEPVLRLDEQSSVWTFGFVLLAALIACASLLVIRTDATGSHGRATLSAPPLRAAAILRYVGLAFVPSGLLVAVTAQLSTDVAAAPLLWVLPLALFLLTFVLAFREKPLVSHALMLKVQPWLVAAAIMLIASASLFNIFVAIALMLAVYFVCAMVAHGELFQSRPPAIQLTAFYLWMSVGGVLGGIFCALLAPVLFSTVLEYPVLLAGALLCRPAPRPRWQRDALILTALALVLSAPAMLGFAHLPDEFAFARFLMAAALATGIIACARDKGLMVGLAAGVLVLLLAWQTGAGRQVSMRSFFGVHRLADIQDGRVRLLFHGTTIHGAQRLTQDDGAPVAGRPEMLSYYFDGGSFQKAIVSARSAQGGLPDVAVVGLGAGVLACAAKPQETWRFFEIDPEIIRIARDPGKFSFLSSCQPNGDIIPGDARLTLAADQHVYDLIVLDAFSSDSIPVHLLTREALQLYLSRLKPHGSLILHISNRHMQLADVIASVTADLGLTAWLGKDAGPLDFARDIHAHATVALVARNDADLGPVPADAHWTKLKADPAVRVWTDDYSNIVQVIWRKYLP